MNCDVNENHTYQRFVGNLIHRKVNSFPAISTLNSKELQINFNQQILLNPWFNVLVETYFNYPYFNKNNIKSYFEDSDKKKEEENKIKFFLKQINDNFYLSFKSILRDKKENQNKHLEFIDEEVIMFLDKNQISKAIKICIEIFPYTPRSLLIYNSTFDVITEVESIGADQYRSIDATGFFGKPLDRFMIDNYNANIDELEKIYSDKRICALFIEDTCKESDLDCEYLYIIDKHTEAQCNLLQVVKERVSLLNKKTENLNPVETIERYDFFQFSPYFIHPSLVYHDEAKKCIRNWFKNCCDFKIKEIIGHKFRMKVSEIQELQSYVFFNEDKIKEEMKLQYKAIAFPTAIREMIPKNKKWYVDNNFHTIIVKTEEEKNEVLKFINDKMENIDTNTPKLLSSNSMFFRIGCYDDCSDPELIETPFTILFRKDENNESIKTIKSMKICKNCIHNRLRHATKFFLDKKQNYSQPPSITYIKSNYFDNGTKMFPQIPLGQFALSLFGDKNISSSLSTYLNSISDFTIRYKMKEYLTFCPDHNYIYKVGDGFSKVRCTYEDCKNFYCRICCFMHDSDYDCIKNDNLFSIYIYVRYVVAK